MLLKAGEGAVEFLFSELKQEIARLLPEIPDEAGGKLIKSLRALKLRYEYHEYGGGPLLGIRGSCIICHGSSDARAIKNALRVASTLATDQVNNQIIHHLEAAPKVEEVVPTKPEGA